MDEEDLADRLAAGWRVWSADEERLVLTYRPDVFEGSTHPAPCLPTVYVTRGRRDRRPGVDPSPGPGASWYVTLFLEPDVERSPERFDARTRAVDAALDLCARFARGEVDYRSLYQVTDDREGYLAALEELTGRENGG